MAWQGRRKTPDSRAICTRAEDQLFYPTIKVKTCQSKAAAGEWWQQSRRSKEGEIASEPDVKPCWYGVYLLDVQRDCLLPNQVIPSTTRHIIQCTDSFGTFGC